LPWCNVDFWRQFDVGVHDWQSDPNRGTKYEPVRQRGNL